MTEMQDRLYKLIMSRLKFGDEHAVSALVNEILEAMLEPTPDMQKALEAFSPNEWDPGMYLVMVKAALGRNAAGQ